MEAAQHNPLDIINIDITEKLLIILKYWEWKQKRKDIKGSLWKEAWGSSQYNAMTKIVWEKTRAFIYTLN